MLEKINSAQRQILQLLVQYRFLTTRELQTRLEWPYLKTWRTLAKLRKLGLARDFRCEPEKGTRSEIAWLLTASGAKAVDFTGYNSHFSRRPSRDRFYLHSLELEVERQVKLADWQLIKPLVVSSTAPLPATTEQTVALREALLTREYLLKGGEFSPSSNSSFYTLVVPLQANQPVATIGLAQPAENKPTLRLAVVFLLCPPTATRRFWQERAKEYQALAEYLPVVAVFGAGQENLARHYKPLLASFGFKLLTIDRLSLSLQRIYTEFSNSIQLVIKI